jgi:hypothetical protein
MKSEISEKKWNLSRKNALNLIIKLMENILQDNKKKISINRLPIFLKKEYRIQSIKVKKGGSYRNINTYIKENYGSVSNFFKQNNNIFSYKENIIAFKTDFLKDRDEYIFI